jgi:hypothetical protein
MKTVVKSVLLGLSLFAAFCALLVVSASAVEARPTNIDKTIITTVSHAAFPSASGQVINVNVEKPAGEALLVTFVTKQGDVLAEKLVTKQAGTYSVKFNVEQLPDGVYCVRIMGKQTVGEYTFTLKSAEAQQASRTLSLQ